MESSYCPCDSCIECGCHEYAVCHCDCHNLKEADDQVVQSVEE